MKFFEAVQPDVVVCIDNNGRFGLDIAQEPNASNSVAAVNGIFTFSRTGSTASDLTVHYRISGTASNGVDYTNIFSYITVPAGNTSTNLLIGPLEDNLIEFEETVTLTLIRTNGYFPCSNSTATVTIEDYFPTNIFTVVATNLSHPVGIDYHSPSNSLLVSYNYDSGQPNNFARIDTNGFVTNWSAISGLPEEIKIATAKATVNGFTNGEMFFAQARKVKLDGCLLMER